MNEKMDDERERKAIETLNGVYHGYFFKDGEKKEGKLYKDMVPEIRRELCHVLFDLLPDLNTECSILLRSMILQLFIELSTTLDKKYQYYDILEFFMKVSGLDLLY